MKVLADVSFLHLPSAPPHSAIFTQWGVCVMRDSRFVMRTMSPVTHRRGRKAFAPSPAVSPPSSLKMSRVELRGKCRAQETEAERPEAAVAAARDVVCYGQLRAA